MASGQLKPSNVFLTASEPHGRIVRNSDFKKLYVCEQSTAHQPNQNDEPRRVFPIKDLEKNDVNRPPEMPKPASSNTKKWDALSKLAYNVLKLSSCDEAVIINRSLNEIVRSDKNTQKKTIYRFLSNEELGVKPPRNQVTTNPIIPAVQKNKLGRPRKRAIEEVKSTATNDEERISEEKKLCTTENSNELKMPPAYSRFGRALKPVKQLHSSTSNDSKEEPMNNFMDETRHIITEMKDKDFTCNFNKCDMTTALANENNKITVKESTSVPNATSSPAKRHVPPESICPTCKKIFLGKRLKRHFVDHPDHMKQAETAKETNEQSNDDISLFRFLVFKLQKSNLNEDQRADLFIHELNDLVEQLQLRSSRLIRNTSGLHMVTTRTARVLGIPEGQYALDMSAIDTTPEPEPSCLINFDVNALPIPSNNTRSLDYTAISLDDTLTDEAAQKLNLSAGGKLLPPSEESLLRAVDDFVPPTGIVATNLINQSHGVSTTISSSSPVDTIVPHYDHASDNAVEAVTMKTCHTGNQAQPILDLSVDFFQFNTKK